MAHRSGSGSRELNALAEELAEFRQELARRFDGDSRDGLETELADIQAHLQRIGEELQRTSVGPGEGAPPQS